MAKGRRVQTIELYRQVVTAYRTEGPNHTAAGRVANVSKATAKKLYEFGWPNVPGALPIKDVLLKDQLMVRAARAGADPEEQVAVAQQVLAASLDHAREDAKTAAEMLANAAKKAEEMHRESQIILNMAQNKLAEVEALSRAKIEEAEKAARATLTSAELEAKKRLGDLLQKAKVDAAETLADEANAAKFGRKAALSAVAISALVLKDAQLIASKLREAMGPGMEALGKLTPREAIRTAREMVRLVEAAEKALILALQAERLRVGQPTEIVGVASADGTLEEKEIKLRALNKVFERARQRGLSVVNGGPPAAVEEKEKQL